MKFWYYPKVTLMAAVLWPLTGLIYIVCFFKRRFRNTHPYSKPVIVVGNINVGGTGKTPTLIWLVDQLIQEGLRPAIVSRGYKAQPLESFPILVGKHHDAVQVGDEPWLMYLKTEVPVVIDPQRDRAVRFCCSRLQNQIDVILSDDGLQHYAMYRDFEIALIDPHRLLGNKLLFPAGPLREPPARLAQCNLILAKSKPSGPIHVDAYAQMKFLPIQNCLGETLENQSVHLVSGIGNFEAFYQSVLELGFNVISCHELVDHQPIPDSLISSLIGPIVITEKDAVKLREQTPNIYVLPLRLSYPSEISEHLIVNIKKLIDEKSSHYSCTL